MARGRPRKNAATPKSKTTTRKRAAAPVDNFDVEDDEDEIESVDPGRIQELHTPIAPKELTEMVKLLRGVINAIANLTDIVKDHGLIPQGMGAVPQPIIPHTAPRPNGGAVSHLDFAPAPRAPVVTREQVTEALQRVSAAHGIGQVKAALDAFKADRLSAVAETDYAEFVEYCNGLTANAAAPQPQVASFL